MEKYFDVSIKILDLSDTIKQALEHINILLDELKLEESFVLLQDVTEGIFSIEKALYPITVQLPVRNDFPATLQNLHDSLKSLITAYENKNLADFKTVLGNVVIPNYCAWHQQVEELLSPQTSS